MSGATSKGKRLKTSELNTIFLDNKKYFESKCLTDDGTIFFTTRCSEYEVIFNKFEQFKKFELIYPSE